ncbi:MAG: hypothetical protein AB1938_17470 [Myxococcota bacterium]
MPQALQGRTDAATGWVRSCVAALYQKQTSGGGGTLAPWAR